MSTYDFGNETGRFELMCNSLALPESSLDTINHPKKVTTKEYVDKCYNDIFQLAISPVSSQYSSSVQGDKLLVSIDGQLGSNAKSAHIVGVGNSAANKIVLKGITELKVIIRTSELLNGAVGTIFQGAFVYRDQTAYSHGCVWETALNYNPMKRNMANQPLIGKIAEDIPDVTYGQEIIAKVLVDIEYPDVNEAGNNSMSVVSRNDDGTTIISSLYSCFNDNYGTIFNDSLLPVKVDAPMQIRRHTSLYNYPLTFNSDNLNISVDAPGYAMFQCHTNFEIKTSTFAIDGNQSSGNPLLIFVKALTGNGVVRIGSNIKLYYEKKDEAVTFDPQSTGLFQQMWWESNNDNSPTWNLLPVSKSIQLPDETWEYEFHGSCTVVSNNEGFTLSNDTGLGWTTYKYMSLSGGKDQFPTFETGANSSMCLPTQINNSGSNFYRIRLQKKAGSSYVSYEATFFGADNNENSTSSRVFRGVIKCTNNTPIFSWISNDISGSYIRTNGGSVWGALPPSSPSPEPSPSPGSSAKASGSVPITELSHSSDSKFQDVTGLSGLVDGDVVMLSMNGAMGAYVYGTAGLAVNLFGYVVNETTLRIVRKTNQWVSFPADSKINYTVMQGA